MQKAGGTGWSAITAESVANFRPTSSTLQASPRTGALSLVCVLLASFSLLLGFDAADRMIRHGVAADWAWYLAFGLVMTLAWLYLEILWLLSGR